MAITYDGAPAPPTAAGSYAVVATVTDPNYTGSASGTLVVDPALATVTLGGLAQLFDGTPRIVTATTVPPGLPVAISYDGAPTPPTAAGSYAVVATVTDPNYTGSASGTLVVGVTECSDGLDNDGNTLIDFPADPGCSSLLDAIESSPLDSDGDGVPDASDNCPYEPNANQTDSGGLNTPIADGVGDACQCGDVNDDGIVTSSDATVLSRALLNLSPAFSVGGNAACTAADTPAACCTGQGTGSCDPGLGAAGLAKCNVGATPTPGVAGCTASDATLISRAMSNLSPGIAQSCDAAQP